jgi:hypothetical protein
VDISQMARHSDEVRSSASFAQRQWRRCVRLGTLTLSTVALVGIGAAAMSPGASAVGVHHARFDRSSQHHKRQPQHHKSKPHQSGSHPCLEGNWNVASITLSTSGLSFTGGAGTTVDIMSNGNALGNFTPGTPLTGSEGSAKFNGTVTDHYGFPAKTSAHSGTFPVTTVTDDATITVAGVTKPVTPSPEQGAYSCTGKDLSLTFTSGASTLSYQLTPAG